MKFATDFYLILRLRMNRLAPVLPLYASMSWTGTTLALRKDERVIKIICIADWLLGLK
jgi:hypothetical protein